MEKETDPTKTLGQAIDELIRALGPLDEPSRLTAIKAACEHLKIPLVESRQDQHRAPPVPLHEPGSIPAAPPRVTDIKSLREEKQPSSAHEMAALVAFYLSELAPEGERKSDVRTEDMVKYFKQSGFRLPKQPRMLLVNAKNAGYFDPGASGGYKLNPVGYNLVAHSLPRASSSSGGASRRRKRGRTTVVRARKSK